MFLEELRKYDNLGDHWLSLFRTSDCPIVIFGCGIVGQKRMKALQDEGVNVTAFVDNSVQRVGSLFMGLPVLSFAVLEEQYRNAFVLVASRVHRKAMFTQLSAAGFAKEQVTDIEFSFYSQARRIREEAVHYAALCDEVFASLGDVRSK